MQTSVAYLGHIVSSEGVHTDPAKVEVIRCWPVPANVKNVRSFLGLAGYYKKFVMDYATIAEPLINLTRKHANFHWTTSCQNSLDTLKDALTKALVLAYPDPAKSYILDTDCSGIGAGAVLCQTDDNGLERPIAYHARTLNPAERRYSVTKEEMCALVSAVKHFKPYLYGAKFTIHTDHSSLAWLSNMKAPTGILTRWLEILSQFDFVIQHRPGNRHSNADSLSRMFEDAVVADCAHTPSLEGNSILQVQAARCSNAVGHDADEAEQGTVTRSGREVHPPARYIP